MKVCVINFSGNVGKTTVAANLLAPRMGAELFSVESLNQDAAGDKVEAKRLRAQRFGELQSEILKRDAAIVDVGASNVETYLEMMGVYEESQHDYDYYIVPTVKDRKQTADTVNTIAALRKLGVGPERIKVVFNKVEKHDVLAEEFAALFGMAARGELEIDERAVLYKNEVFELIKDGDQSLAEVIADATDHREALRQATTEHAKDEAIARLAIKRLSTSCARNMDAAYAALFPA
jgi:MinD-like ATPase involved in chromosome partitioning or flagellar assembly